MPPARIPAAAAERLSSVTARFALSETAERSLRALVDLLVADPRAPTTVRDPLKVVDDHVADSLVALELELVREASHFADIGSGAGFPGLPLAMARPEARFTLLESNQRKVEFMEQAVKRCGLTNVELVGARVESWAVGLGVCDVVTARAVADLDVVAEYAAPLLGLGGALVAWRGRRDPEAEARGRRAAALLGLRTDPPRQVFPYAEAQHRHLHVMHKVADTPPGFPRRPGIAAKRPLGRRARGGRLP